MPKAPATSVVIHRIEFQESERRMLEVALAAYSVDKASESVAQLTNLIVLIFGAAVVADKWDELLDWYTRQRAEGQQGGTYGGTDADVYDEKAATLVGGIQNLINNILDTIFRHPLM
jgi:uncharacterized membrane protein YjdF